MHLIPRLDERLVQLIKLCLEHGLFCLMLRHLLLLLRKRHG